MERRTLGSEQHPVFEPRMRFHNCGWHSQPTALVPPPAVLHTRTLGGLTPLRSPYSNFDIKSQPCGNEIEDAAADTSLYDVAPSATTLVPHIANGQ